MRLLVLLLLVAVFHSNGQDSIKVAVLDLPYNHNYKLPVYMAGSMNGWNPADPDYQLVLMPDSSYSISINIEKDIEFKFTRGSWETVERNADCSDNRNRVLEVEAKEYIARIDRWANNCIEQEQVSTALKNVGIVKDSFYMPQFDRYRTVRIFLPDNYSDTTMFFPVLYMHDGQNLFDDLTSYSGEWGVDEAIDSLVRQGAAQAIVIGIDNGEAFRIEEYTPWSHAQYGGGEGDKYADFLVNTLKPCIDSVYRTLPDRENTAIAGSSLGGLISWYIGMKYPETFGKIGVFSPSFWFSDSTYAYATNHEMANQTKFYFVAGGKEGNEIDVVADCRQMMDTMFSVGYDVEDLKLIIDPEGRHHETFWRSTFPGFYSWLWGK